MFSFELVDSYLTGLDMLFDLIILGCIGIMRKKSNQNNTNFLNFI